MFIDYLFYRFSQIRIHKPAYWAKIFIPITLICAYMPFIVNLSRFFFGCYDSEENDGLIKITLLAAAVLAWMVSSAYFSPRRVKMIHDKYSGESKSMGHLKLTLNVVLLAGVFMYGPTLLKVFVNVPDC